MERSKANFKGRRETVGLTQQNIADAAEVTLTTVKRWEKPGFPEPPDDVWEWLESHERVQERISKALVSVAIRDDAEIIRIAYYRSQDHYNEFGRDFWPYNMVNATARLAAMQLEILECDFEFCYPEDEEDAYCFDDFYKLLDVDSDEGYPISED